jgi:hypothetical protein
MTPRQDGAQFDYQRDLWRHFPNNLAFVFQIVTDIIKTLLSELPRNYLSEHKLMNNLFYNENKTITSIWTAPKDKIVLMQILKWST